MSNLTTHRRYNIYATFLPTSDSDHFSADFVSKAIYCMVWLMLYCRNDYHDTHVSSNSGWAWYIPHRFQGAMTSTFVSTTLKQAVHDSGIQCVNLVHLNWSVLQYFAEVMDSWWLLTCHEIAVYQTGAIICMTMGYWDTPWAYPSGILTIIILCFTIKSDGFVIVGAGKATSLTGPLKTLVCILGEILWFHWTDLYVWYWGKICRKSSFGKQYWVLLQSYLSCHSSVNWDSHIYVMPSVSAWSFK